MLIETLEYLGIALISSVLLIIMSKIILQAIIRRPADYYSAEEMRQEELMLNEGGISITYEHETNPEGETIEESHIEPMLGDSEPAEPEEIMSEIPGSVHESIETDHSEDEVELVPDDLSELETELTLHDPDEPEMQEYDISEFNEEGESAPRSEQQQADSDLEPEPERIEPRGFKITARTSREMQPKKKEEDIDTAAAAETNEAGEKASGWSESYADIRQSLEKAYDENQKPSMRLKKQVLIDIAVARGIDIPDKATKRDILDLINALDE